MILINFVYRQTDEGVSPSKYKKSSLTVCNKIGVLCYSITNSYEMSLFIYFKKWRIFLNIKRIYYLNNELNSIKDTK